MEPEHPGPPGDWGHLNSLWEHFYVCILLIITLTICGIFYFIQDLSGQQPENNNNNKKIV